MSSNRLLQIVMISLPRTSIVVRVALCLLTVALLGCDGQRNGLIEPEEVGDQSSPASIESVVVAAAEYPIAEDPGLGSLSLQSDALQFHRRLADELSNVDPSSAGWESEAFSEFVSSEMKHAVAEYLEHPSAADPDLIAALVSEGFACSSLRAEKLTTLMNEHEISVDEGSVATSDRKYLDAKGFMEALSLLLQPFGAATEVYAKFKVMHVEKQESQILTRLLFEMSGKQPVGRVQVTAVWHCMWTVESPWRLKSIDVTNYREVTPGIGRIEFADIAPAVLSKTSSYGEQLSKSFDYWRARSDRSLVADLLGAQGIAVGDVNGDLLDDIYVLQPGGLPNRLFIHQSDGSAIDYSVESGVDILDFCRSALFVDFDNDGDQDLAVGLAWTLVVFENDGHGHFIKRGEFPSDGQINSMAAADYDLDGRVDLYLCGRDASGEIKSEQGALGIPMPYYDANNGGPNTLLRNEGEFGFADVTESAGMNVNNRRFSLACAWEDFDNDGDQDLYVSNDFGRNNLFRNDGNGTFTDVAEAAGVVDVGPGMSAAWGDYNNDGLMDLYVGNMWSNAGNRITLQQQFLPGADQSARNQARRHARGNSVYLNSGDGSFRDLTQQSGANMARWAWSSKFTDLNNDGRQDLIVANGMITTEDSGDL